MTRKRKIIVLVTGFSVAAMLLLSSLIITRAHSRQFAPRSRVGIAGVSEAWEPEDFIHALPDGMAASFRRAPNPNRPGTQRVTLQVITEDGRRIRLRAQLRLLEPRDPLKFELGFTPEPLSPWALFEARNQFDAPMAFSPAPTLRTTPGEQTLQLLLDGRSYEFTIHIVDTIAPRAIVRNIETFVGAPLTPEDFFDEIDDQSFVALSFVNEPDMTLYGETQVVEILLRDHAGNESTVQAELRITEQDDPPEIHGLRDIYVGRGGTIAFRRGVTVTHSSDAATLEIDSSGVNIAVPGEYEATYIARTPAGHETRVTVRVTVSEVTEESALALVEPILAAIIQENMSKTEQAQAILAWIRNNIAYNITGVHGSVLDGVYQGMNLRRGDCFTFYVLAKFMLDQLGIESVSMERYPVTNTRHYWLLLDLGDGWHHFDPTPIRTPAPNYGFMMTASEAEAFDPFGWGYFYRFDPASIPEGVEVVRE